MFEEIYMDMDIALPRCVEDPEFAKVYFFLRDTNGIPIGRQQDNPIMDTRV